MEVSNSVLLWMVVHRILKNDMENVVLEKDLRMRTAMGC